MLLPPDAVVKNGSRDFQAAPKVVLPVSERGRQGKGHPACTGSDLPCAFAASSKWAMRDFVIPTRRQLCTVLIGAFNIFATAVVPPKKSIISFAFLSITPFLCDKQNNGKKKNSYNRNFYA